MSHMDGLEIFSNVPPIDLKKEWTEADFNPTALIYPDTKEYYASEGNYNDIIKQLNPNRGAKQETQKAGISLAVVALEALYHNPTFDPRVSFLWYNVLAQLSDYEHAAEVLAALQKKMVVPSTFLADLLREVHEYLQFEKQLFVKVVGAEMMDDTQFLHRYSPQVIKDFVCPKAIVYNINPCVNLLPMGSKLPQSKLVRYIVLDTHRLEGDLSQIDTNRPGLTNRLISLEFRYNTLKDYKIADQTYVLAILRSSYNLLTKIMVAYSKNTRAEKRLNMTKEKLLDIHAELFKSFRCTVMRSYDSECGKIVSKFGIIATGRFRSYSNSMQILKGPKLHFCPPARVETDLTLFFKLLDEHLSKNRDPFLVAAWAHHFFYKIHPFQHGNKRMARTLVTIVFCRYKLLPLLVRLEDEVRYEEAILDANTGNILKLANFFADMQVQALMIIIAEDETTKKPSQKYEMSMHIARDTALEYFSKYLPASVVVLRRLKNDDWNKLPFSIGRKNSFYLRLSRVKDDTLYAKLLFGPLKPWRNGLLAVYLQGIGGDTMQLTCINLLSPETIPSEMNFFLKNSHWLFEVIQGGCAVRAGPQAMGGSQS